MKVAKAMCHEVRKIAAVILAIGHLNGSGSAYEILSIISHEFEYDCSEYILNPRVSSIHLLNRMTPPLKPIQQLADNQLLSACLIDLVLTRRRRRDVMQPLVVPSSLRPRSRLGERERALDVSLPTLWSFHCYRP